MDFVDGQFYCYKCETSVRLSDYKYHCTFHDTIVDITLYQMWYSACHNCPFRESCDTRKKGGEYQQNILNQQFARRFGQVI